jgi:uncharacterized protein (TIGR00369 family)
MITQAIAPPPGFVRHYRQSPLTDPWEPLYSCKTAESVRIGLWADTAHTNSRGFVHGGLISALADNAMGLTCGLSIEGGPGLVTVNLAVDFLGSARKGQWLEVQPRAVRNGATLCFADAVVTADGKVCARANATFMVVKRPPPG